MARHAHAHRTGDERPANVRHTDRHRMTGQSERQGFDQRPSARSQRVCQRDSRWAWDVVFNVLQIDSDPARVVRRARTNPGLSRPEVRFRGCRGQQWRMTQRRTRTVIHQHRHRSTLQTHTPGRMVLIQPVRWAAWPPGLRPCLPDHDTRPATARCGRGRLPEACPHPGARSTRWSRATSGLGEGESHTRFRMDPDTRRSRRLRGAGAQRRIRFHRTVLFGEWARFEPGGHARTRWERRVGRPTIVS